MFIVILNILLLVSVGIVIHDVHFGAGCHISFLCAVATRFLTSSVLSSTLFFWHPAKTRLQNVWFGISFSLMTCVCSATYQNLNVQAVLPLSFPYNWLASSPAWLDTNVTLGCKSRKTYAFWRSRPYVSSTLSLVFVLLKRQGLVAAQDLWLHSPKDSIKAQVHL